ncbi:hypothetical protein [Cellulomonas alba]|uniref:Lipoprotein n=1 Tax=Cellulomonas alba TaxID=3053467 RepID=A0ABT7SCL7_9CELL|nr:hypothetical protein [Cellulomonas alba]MDM7853931.1 hypothetical protein [Cellulomonas alba]
MSHTTSTALRRLTTAAVTAVLALGVGAVAAACASSAGGSPKDDEVATANHAAASETDVAADAYQELSSSITEARDLATEATGKVEDTALLDNLTAATDAARAIDPIGSYKPVDDAATAQTKLQALRTAEDKMNAAKTALDTAIAAVKNAES